MPEAFMLFTLLLLMLLGDAQGLAASRPSAEEAGQPESAGRYDEALAALQQRAASNPNDRVARLAIGRLHERMGHPDRAEAVFRSVLLEDSTSVEALLGVGRTLLNRLRWDEALEVLDRAEKLAPSDPDVLTALGRAHRDAGHAARAVDYFGRVASLSPGEESRMRLEQARRAHQHRVESRSFSEQFSGSTPNSRNTDLSVNYRINDVLRLTGRGQLQRKFGTDDARGGAGVEWRWAPSATLVAHALVGPGNVVMPKGDYLGEIDYGYRSATWTMAVRYFDFEGPHVTTVSPAVTWSLSSRASVGLGYALSLTDSPVAPSEKGHSAQVRGSYRLRPRMNVLASYSRGVDSFETFSVDRIGAFSANTGSIGAHLDLPSLTTIVTTYEYQRRTDDTSMGRVTVSLAQRF
jgi:YaiO family outer membrane protein